MNYNIIKNHKISKLILKTHTELSLIGHNQLHMNNYDLRL